MAFFHASSRPRLFITSRARPDVYDFATTAEDDSGAFRCFLTNCPQLMNDKLQPRAKPYPVELKAMCFLSIYFLDYLLFVFHKEIEKAANDEYVSHVLSTLKQMKSSGHDKHVSMGSGQGYGQSVVLNVSNPEPTDSRGRMQAGKKVRFHSQPQRQFFKISNSAFFLTSTCSNSQNHFSNMDRCFFFANLINTISVINSHRWLGSFRGAVQLRHLSWSYAKANQLFMTGDQLSPTP
ncbi:hypothetical protein T4A_1687 [Trichinella pseudospiralis]|uniref:Uncharacterized protein n=1 Tax=Trichinella pseudospiralis TaxID=6337 RepID=A0A0V1E7W6_TRIPS|nr:hypothetical protein T4A_1687 [Trichinella pseudospiralis]KRZ29510.1 hypothetical protein T4C_9816 [Trichinella pseudospiralis]